MINRKKKVQHKMAKAILQQVVGKPVEHVASLDSDLVRLTREFESLKAEIESLTTARREHEQSIEAAHINYNMAISHNEKKIEHIDRQRRVVDARMENCRGLLGQLTDQ